MHILLGVPACQIAGTPTPTARLAPVWKAWTTAEYVMKWWGPKGFTSPVCRIDLRTGGRLGGRYCGCHPSRLFRAILA